MSPTGSPSYPTPLHPRGRATNRGAEINLSGWARFPSPDVGATGALRPLREVLRLHLRGPPRLRRGRPLPGSGLPEIPPREAPDDPRPGVRDGEPRDPARPPRIRSHRARSVARSAGNRNPEGPCRPPPRAVRRRGHAIVPPRGAVRCHDLHVRRLRIRPVDSGRVADAPDRAQSPRPWRALRVRVLAELRGPARPLPGVVPQGGDGVRACPPRHRALRAEDTTSSHRLPVLRLQRPAGCRPVRGNAHGPHISHRGGEKASRAERLPGCGDVRNRCAVEEGIRAGSEGLVPRLRGGPLSPLIGPRRTSGNGGGPRCPL